MLSALLSNGSIDGFFAPNNEVAAILRNYPQFTVMMNSHKNSVFPSQPDIYSDVSVIIASSNYSYTPNRHDLESVKRPGIKITGITGS